MPVRIRRVDLTADDYGAASEDVSTGVGFPQARWCGLFGVEVESESSRQFQVDIYEVDFQNDDDENDEESYGKLLFHVRDPRSGYVYQPRIESNTEAFSTGPTSGAASVTTGEENVMAQVGTGQLRIDVEGADAGDEVTVKVYLATAGDQRF